MFADSPGLHGVEHPIYDVWLINCKGGTTVIHDAPQTAASTPDADNPDAATDANALQSPETPAPQQPPKKRARPRAPTVISAPIPPPQNSGPLDLMTAPGNARGR